MSLLAGLWHVLNKVADPQDRQFARSVPVVAPGLGLVGMAAELSDLIGREVDVLTRPSVERSPDCRRRKEILATAELVYAAQ